MIEDLAHENSDACLGLHCRDSGHDCCEYAAVELIASLHDEWHLRGLFGRDRAAAAVCAHAVHDGIDPARASRRHYLVGAKQSPLIQDGGVDAAFTRIVTIDIGSGAVRESAHELTNIDAADKPKYGTISEILPINNT